MEIEIHSPDPVFARAVHQALTYAGLTAEIRDKTDDDHHLALIKDQGTQTLPLKTPLRLGHLIDQVVEAQNRTLHDWPEQVRIGPHELTPYEGRFARDDGEDFTLTEKECELLIYLWRRQQQGQGAATRDDLLEQIWGYKAGIETHTLETHIYRLRRKIEHDPTAPKILMTGDAGYYLNIL